MKWKHLFAVAALLLAWGCGFGQTKADTGSRETTPDSIGALTSAPIIPAGASDTTSLSFKDTDLRDIFRALSHEHGVNIFLDNSIAKRVTVSLNRVRVYDAIKFLASENGLELQLEGGIFKILPPPPPPKPEPPPPHVPIVAFESSLLSVQLKDDELEKVILEIQKPSDRC